ncbi:portal protein [Vibrio sp. V31_P5A7T61]|uniref:portal protein n=1 Tax=unclassified Vibrio TaxID=2614977 RepID=UPI0013724D5B|nr:MULTISPECIES: portal protein [unclassified Vibrio]NAW60498.1 portal protein [Vibrio sp. V31_P5A7T61]NAX02006.1 portal protein [Vibrio sp. V34_P3A8T189]NAX08112.1 portal protein [Vibrio sp. V40_P2S30T141]NAX63942.1 portal protein [Vibrio sp. V32_P6A28T40]
MKKIEQQKLLNIMSDIDAQPNWRTHANKACAYYDGDQLAPQVVAVLKERNQPMTMHNLIAPTVDGVLGMEAKTRTDLLVLADDPSKEFDELAEAINEQFKDVCRLAKLDKARSEAYASQIKCGFGAVEVYRNENLFGPKYKIKNIPRDEIYWDWLSKESDWSDARWVMRCRWIDVDELMTIVPDKKDIIKNAANGWHGFVETNLIEGMDANLVNAYEEFKGYSRQQTEWLSQNRKRIRLQVIYYRTMERKPVIELQNGRVIEFDKNNLLHATAAAMGKANVRMAQVSRIIESWYAGPHHLGDKDCDAPQGLFPLVPFFGYRKDANGEPYGLVARAIPAQDEVNFRRIKLTWLLQAKRVIADKDATNMSREKVLDEVERADGYIELNPDRKNNKSVAEAFRVEQDFNIAQQQFNVMQESMKLIQDTMGVYAAFLGQGQTSQSGVAIANLVEQGATTLAEINDNYRYSCQLLGELILSYLIEDMKGKRNVPITINRDDPRKRKQVIVNQETEEGLTNDITKLRTHIALAPVQQTAAYKQQLADRMMQITAQMPPEVQVAVIDLVAELTDIPNKAEFIDRVRDAIGIQKPQDEMSEEEIAAMEAQQQQQEAQMQLAMREMEAKVQKLEAEVQKSMAVAEKEQAAANSARYRDAKTQAETGKLLQEIERMDQELQQIRNQWATMIEQQLDALTL